LSINYGAQYDRREPRGVASLSTQEKFDQALSATGKLVDEGILTWRLRGSSGLIEARIDEQSLETKHPEVAKDTALLQILRGEISPLLTVAVAEMPVDALRSYFGFEEPAPDFSVLTKRLAEVKKRLCTKRLRERYLIRRTSKGETLTDLRWDISTKRHDFSIGTLDGLSFATIELVTSPSTPEESAGFFFRAWWPQQSSSVLFDCHLDDVDDLINDLIVVRDNLRKLEDERAAVSHRGEK
jgi:hypothetical protein